MIQLMDAGFKRFNKEIFMALLPDYIKTMQERGRPMSVDELENIMGTVRQIQQGEKNISLREREAGIKEKQAFTNLTQSILQTYNSQEGEKGEKPETDPIKGLMKRLQKHGVDPSGIEEWMAQGPPSDREEQILYDDLQRRKKSNPKAWKKMIEGKELDPLFIDIDVIRFLYPHPGIADVRYLTNLVYPHPGIADVRYLTDTC